MRPLIHPPILAIIVVSALNCATASNAQKPIVGDEARRFAQQFGDCSVERNPIDAKSVVLTPVELTEVQERFPKLLTYHCFAGSRPNDPSYLRLPYPSLYLILSEALIRREFAETGPSDIAGRPAMAPIFYKEATEEELDRMSKQERLEYSTVKADVAGWQILQKLGLCVARSAPDTVRRLALTMVATKAESELLAELRPAVARCIPPDTSIRLKSADVRSVSALGYYRLAHASSASDAAAAKVTR